jgi:hypothetical protein
MIDEEAKLGEFPDENQGLMGSPDRGRPFTDGPPFDNNVSNGFNSQPMFGEFN